MPLWLSSDDDLRALGARLVDHLLHVVVLDAEGPVRDQVARVGDRRVREGLADDGHRHAVDLAHHVGLEHRIAEVGRLDVLRDEVDPAREVLLDDLLHALHAVGELPVAGHHVDAERLAGVDHVLARWSTARWPNPARCRRRRAAARPGGWPSALDQRGQVREAADLAVAARGALEVEVGEGVRQRRARLDAGAPSAGARRPGAAAVPRMSPTPRLTLGSRKWIGLSCAWQSVMCRKLHVAGAGAQRRDVVQRLLGGGGIGVGRSGPGPCRPRMPAASTWRNSRLLRFMISRSLMFRGRKSPREAGSVRRVQLTG